MIRPINRPINYGFGLVKVICKSLFRKKSCDSKELTVFSIERRSKKRELKRCQRVFQRKIIILMYESKIF
jgi:hypothetical protein